MTSDNAPPEPKQNQAPVSSRWTWWLLFPLRLILEIAVTLFDLTLSRHLMATIGVGLFWLPLHLITGIGYEYWLWPSIAVGLFLSGLWEGCGIFVIRPHMGNWVLVKHERD